jgi:hypothetical protein
MFTLIVTDGRNDLHTSRRQTSRTWDLHTAWDVRSGDRRQLRSGSALRPMASTSFDGDIMVEGGDRRERARRRVTSHLTGMSYYKQSYVLLAVLTSPQLGISIISVLLLFAGTCMTSKCYTGRNVMMFRYSPNCKCQIGITGLISKIRAVTGGVWSEVQRYVKPSNLPIPGYQ